MFACSAVGDPAQRARPPVERQVLVGRAQRRQAADAEHRQKGDLIAIEG